MALTRLVNNTKDSVVAATTGANINLAAAPNTLDGVTLALNNRILVKDQTPASLNGIYRITSLGTGANGSWTRSSDFNDWREATAGVSVFVELGAINGNSFYFINGGEPNVTIGTTAINFSNLYKVKKIAPLAGIVGCLDVIAGGGWGTMLTSNLIKFGYEPKKVIASVNTAQFFLSTLIGISLGFIIELIHWEAIAGLILGGLIMSPIAAKLSSKIKAEIIIFFVASLIIFFSSRKIYLSLI